ncbi:MAG: WbqC family protein, partial [Bacteroidota bacterium]
LATEQGRSGGVWAKNHWRSIQNAYSRAPFFEYLEDDLSKLILETGELLMDYNLKVLAWLIHRLALDVQITESEVMRPLSQPWVLLLKEGPWKTPRYFQQFEAQTHFVPGLSVLDLLIQCGPHESKAYLERYLVLNASNFDAQP